MNRYSTRGQEASGDPLKGGGKAEVLAAPSPGTMDECQKHCQNTRKECLKMLQNLRQTKESKEPERLREAIDLAIQSCEQIERTMSKCLDDPKTGCMGMHKMAQMETERTDPGPAIPTQIAGPPVVKRP